MEVFRLITFISGTSGPIRVVVGLQRPIRSTEEIHGSLLIFRLITIFSETSGPIRVVIGLLWAVLPEEEICGVVLTNQPIPGLCVDFYRREFQPLRT